MGVCWCSLAGTAACKHCLNNPDATEPFSKTIPSTIGTNPFYQQLLETQPIVRCESCEYYIKHDKRCAVWNHGVHKDDYCSRGLKKEVEE